MTQQTETQRLAAALDALLGYRGINADVGKAAAELRRLHALCGEWENKAATWLASPEAAKRLDGYRELAQRLNAAESVNAQLLEALRDMVNTLTDGPDESDIARVFSVARAAIAAAKGEA